MVGGLRARYGARVTHFDETLWEVCAAIRQTVENPRPDRRHGDAEAGFDAD